MKNKALYWVIGILALVGILYWLYSAGKLNKLLVSLGISAKVSEQGERSMCNDTGNSEERGSAKEIENVSETCLQPVNPPLFLVFRGPKGEVKEYKYPESKVKNWGILEAVQGLRNPGEKFTITTDYGKRTFNQKRLGNNKANPNFDPKFPVTENTYSFVDNTYYPNYKDYPKETWA